MANAADLTPDNRFIALFVGDSGSGKTPASCTFAHEGPVLVLDFDGRIRGILGCPWLDEFRAQKKINYNSYPLIKGKTIYERLNQELELIEMTVMNRQQLPFKTIVISSLSGQNGLSSLLLKDAIQFTASAGQKKRLVGPMQMSDPGDYNFVSNAIADLLTFVKSIPGINIIVECHIIDKYDKRDPDNPYSPSEIVGSKLALTDKLAATVPGGFDHIVEFDRRMQGDIPKFYCRFWGDMARTVFPNMPNGWQDITNKDFYIFFKECIRKGQEKSTNGTKANT